MSLPEFFCISWVGDSDGVIMIPRDMVEAVRQKVVEWSASDSAARRQIQAGLPLLAALEKYGQL